MLKPICVPCQRFFRPKKNGYIFIEAMPTENGALPGTQEPDKWVPYKLWGGDLYECEGCGATIVTGVAQRPLAEHYESSFKFLIKINAPQLQVNDC